MEREETLDYWLEYRDALLSQRILLGLDRVAAVKERLGLQFPCPVILVAGTNGKGSTCAMLEAIYRAAGYRTGCYTSPHLLRFNERIRIAGEPVDGGLLANAFAAVEAARGDVSLTAFEFDTLVAAWCMEQAGVEAAILEVGLGGRLDAVNVFDADCAVITGVDLDHMDYLGDTREAIGFEKAGIMRPGRAAICTDPQPPATIEARARDLGAPLHQLGRDFQVKADAVQWSYRSPLGNFHSLPLPALRGAHQLNNAAAALTVVQVLRERLPVAANDVRLGLVQASLPGRFQVLPGRPQIILDVAHNPQAARALAANLRAMPPVKTTYAVFGMLGDKDIEAVVAPLAELVDRWLLGDIRAHRGADTERLRRALASQGLEGRAEACGEVGDAYAVACQRADENDRILAFGSFYTVAAALKARPGS